MESLTQGERTLTKLDVGWMGVLWRLVVGYCLIPMVTTFAGQRTSWVLLYVAFLATLVALRVIPLVARKVLRFNSKVNTVWAARRNIAKKYDCFQWQKLCWIGAGMAAYIMKTGIRDVSAISLAAFCVAAGTIALVFWAKVPAAEKGV